MERVDVPGVVGLPVTTIALTSNTAWYLYNFRGGIIRALIERGFRVVTIAPEDEFSRRLAALGCTVLNIRMDNEGTSPVADVRTWLAYRAHYRRIRPDLVLHFTVKPVIYGTLAAQSLSIPCVSTITGLGTAFIRDSWVTRVVELLYRASQRWPRRVFFQNPDDLKLFVERGLVAVEKAERLPGSGVDLNRYTVASPHGNQQPIFLLIARLLWDKGVREFVEAARRVRVFHPAAQFQLLGSLGVANRTAIPRQEVESWVAEGVVQYLGETDDVRPFISAADCVVLPSYREGTPRTLLEAAAMGRPIITTDTPGCREVVEDGVNGYLCRVQDSDDLAGKIKRFLALPHTARVAMGLRGREKMERDFDERLVIERYLAVINEIGTSQTLGLSRGAR